MRIIAEGGVTTKNVASNSRDAILLTVYSNFANGISLNIDYTKDKDIVIADVNQISMITNGKNSFEDTPSRTVLGHNVGNKVVSHNLLTLDQALDIFKISTKIFMLKIRGELLEDQEFVDKLVSLLDKYPTVEAYVSSTNTNKLTDMMNMKLKALIGVCIDKNNIEALKLNYDFYCLTVNTIDKDIVAKIFDNNRAVLVNEVNTTEQLTKIKELLPKSQCNVMYIITQNYVPLLPML